ncbi:acyl-CoA dehydrogenase family protein [Endozoicomonadaceae bacterium StTr2]
MDFGYSAKTREWMKRVGDFIDNRIIPASEKFEEQLVKGPDFRNWVQPEIMEQLKAEAKAEGLWNMFLPDNEYGTGLTNLEYAPLAELMGRERHAPEVFNCNAPDTGNMELLWKYGSEEQKEQWLKPLLAGDIRSVFFMTEPGVASSDATNMAATCIVEGDEVVLNGCKWWSSNVGHPNARIGIFMGVSDPLGEDRHRRHSMVLVPLDTPGVKIERMLPVFNEYHEPEGHGEVTFNNVRLPVSNIIAGPGRGFEIAQGRLGPGRIHHCMRTIGVAEKALELMCRRGLERSAFRDSLARLGGNPDKIANARTDIEMARLLTLKAAWMMDTVGNKAAMSEISQIKVVAPNVALRILDEAIQIHGGMGVSNDTELAYLYGAIRTLRLADGPDEVHRSLIARLELKKYR